MAARQVDTNQIILTMLLAVIFWYLTFSVQLFNFWLSMAVAASILAALGIVFKGLPVSREDFHRKSLLTGIIAAAALYFLFWVGNNLGQWILPFAGRQIASIYQIRNQGHALVIALVLILITSPAEEIFWRGFIQKWAMEKWGGWQGWLAGAGMYAGVHLASGNFMLVMAALVAGLFWGFLYWRTKNLVPCIISHCLWTVVIFLLLPVV